MTLSVALHLGCQSCDQRNAAASRVVPATSTATLVVPRIDTMRESLVTFLAGIEGASGLLDLVRERYGVDLISRDGLARSGLNPAGQLVLFGTNHGAGLAVDVGDEDAFRQLVEGRLLRVAGAVRLGQLETWPRLAGPSGPDPAWRIAWGVTQDGIGLLVLAHEGVDPRTEWKTLAATQPDHGANALATLTPPDNNTPAFWVVGKGAVSPPASLGFAGAYLEPVLEGITQWQATGEVSTNRMRLELEGQWAGEGTLPTATFRPEGKPANFGALFPKATTLLLRLRGDLSALRAMPSFIRDRLIPRRFPSLDGLPLPSPKDALELLTGDVAIAWMGIDEDVTVNQLMKRRHRGPAALQLLHMALALQVRDRERARQLMAEMKHAAERDAQWQTGEIHSGGWQGISFVKKARSYSVLLKQDVLVLVSGAGEVARFLAVAEGRAATLQSFIENAQGTDVPDAAVLSQDPPALGTFTSFSRVTRELADKGLPPYFLKMLNNVHAVSTALKVNDKTVTLTLDLVL